MPHQPLPLLKALEREYLRTIRPLVDDKSYQHQEQLFQSLYENSEQAVAALENSANALDNHQRYQLMSNQQSLPLSSNMSVQIRWSAAQQHGLKRFAHFLNALLIQHLNLNHISTLSATRVPAPQQDQYLFSAQRNSHRYVILLYKGHAFKLTISDEKGRPATPAQLENALYDLIRTTRDSADLPFALPCYLPREAQVSLLQQASQANLRVCTQIAQALFSVSIDDAHIGDPEDALFNASFGDGSQYLCIKALSYHANLSDNHYYLHAETSLQNPAQIAAHLSAVQANYHAQNFPRRNNLGDKLLPERLEWQFDETTLETLQEHHANYERQAERLISTPYHFFLSDEERKNLKKYNVHALFYALIHYAQWRTYKSLRSTYAIEFTEKSIIAQETVSAQALKLTEALANQERSQSALLRDYLAEYERRYQLAQTGQTPHQQLSALEKLCQPNPPAFYQDPSWAWFLQHPFTIISQNSDMIKSLCFPPKTWEGMAISYGFQRNIISLIITHPRYKSAEVERFTREIQAGLKRWLGILSKQSAL